MKYFFLKDNSRGEVSIPILMGFLIIAGIYISGLMSPMETFNTTQGLVVTITGSLQKNSLEMHALRLITVTPTPTPPPSSLPNGNGSTPQTTTTPGSGTTSITPGSPGSASSGTPNPTQNPQVSGSLICGTNLHLDTANDTFLTSQAFRDGLLAVHVHMIRMPIRTVGGISQTEISAANYIKQMGVTPLVILKFQQSDPAGAAKKVIAQMNSIFGNTTVYYEFGNEVDLAYGVSAQTYTNTWNQVIPQIKSLPTNGKFGGPVNYQSNPSYIAYLVKNGNPKPDFISWHEYTCNSSESTAACTGDIAKWGTHITAIKQAITSGGDTVPPMMITEWNYAPDSGVSSDNKHNDSAFVTSWTQTAMAELKKDGVFGSDQYDVTNSLPLVDNNGNPTAQGKAFAAACANM